MNGRYGRGMAQTSSLDPDERKSVLRFFAWTMLLPLLLVVARETVGGHTVLLRPVPQWVSMLCYAIGLLVGLLLARKFWVIRNAVPQSTAKVAFVSAVMVPLAVVTATYLGRWAFELAAFTGGATDRHKIELRIMGILDGKSGKFVYLRSSATDREIRVKITKTLYVELAAIRPPLWSLRFASEPYCIALESEFGRWGAQRARVPASWDAGLTDYHTCDYSH